MAIAGGRLAGVPQALWAPGGGSALRAFFRVYLALWDNFMRAGYGLVCLRFVAVLEVDLMNAVQTPLSESQGVDYTTGIDRFPAFSFTAASDVQLPAKQIFHPQLWSDFSLTAVVRPLRPEGGFLFAVVSPSGSLVHFGLRIAEGGPDSSKVQLYHTDHRGAPTESTIVAEFRVRPPLTGSWNRLAMKVKGDHVTLLVECSPQGSVTATNRVRDLAFQDGSTFYIAQAGPEFADAKFEVNIVILFQFSCLLVYVLPSSFIRVKFLLRSVT